MKRFSNLLKVLHPSEKIGSRLEQILQRHILRSYELEIEILSKSDFGSNLVYIISNDMNAITSTDTMAQI